MSAKKPASLSASLIARKVAVGPAGPRSEPVKPTSLSESPIARKVAVVPEPAGDVSQPRKRKSSRLPDWRISAAIAVLFAAGVVTAVWQQTAGDRRAESGAVSATDMTTVAEIAEPLSDSVDRAENRAENGKVSTAQQATSAVPPERSETAIPAPAKAPPRQAPAGPPGESFAAAPPPALNVSSAAIETEAPPPAQGLESGAAIVPAVSGKPDSRSKPEPAADIVPPPPAAREISAALRPAPDKSAPPLPRSKPPAKPAYVIQLSAVKTVAGARRETQRLQRSLGQLLKGKQLRVQKAVTRGRGTVYRVHLTGFPNRVGARNLCARIKARALNCLVKKR